MQIDIQRSNRKTISLQVRKQKIIVKAPIFLWKKYILQFVEKNKNWIENKIKNQKKSLINPDKINEYKKQAKIFIPKRVAEIAKEFGFEYKAVKITSAKTRWGSCTSQKNLNFTFRLILTPPEIIDYVICHELAHLKHMNHSRQFWWEVSKMDKDYKQHDFWLKKNWDLFT